MPLIVGASGTQNKIKGSVLNLPVLENHTVKKGDFLQYSYQVTNLTDTLVSSVHFRPNAGVRCQACYIPVINKVFAVYVGADRKLMGVLISRTASGVAVGTPTVIYSETVSSDLFLFPLTVLSGNRVLFGFYNYGNRKGYLLAVSLTDDTISPGAALNSVYRNNEIEPGEGVETENGLVVMSVNWNSRFGVQLYSVQGTTISAVQDPVLVPESSSITFLCPPRIISLKNGNYHVSGSQGNGEIDYVFGLTGNTLSAIGYNSVPFRNSSGNPGYLKMKNGYIVIDMSTGTSHRKINVRGYADYGENNLSYRGSIASDDDVLEAGADNAPGATSLSELPGNGVAVAAMKGTTSTSVNGDDTLCCVLCSTVEGGGVDYIKTVIGSDISTGNKTHVAGFPDGTVLIFHPKSSSSGLYVYSFNTSFVAPAGNAIHGIAMSGGSGGETVKVLIPNYNKEA